MAHDLGDTTDIHAYLAQHQRKDLLRFLTCGSVDDGKSTLIGRLLHDSKLIYEDQLAAIRADSERHNATGGEEIDLSLLVDGLQAEREQGITIDVAYRYFSTSKRKFIIADTPGHEQYTRNMATGASTCDLAVLLIDARHGVQTQTRRHTFIAALLGIKHLLVAVNKMDIVGYSEAVFHSIQEEYRGFVARLGPRDVTFIPISALKGDNVVHPSEHTPWYQGPTLVTHLETVPLDADQNLDDLRFPVQWVNRPHLDFRGYCGTIASGRVRPGDAVLALPSRIQSRVKSIITLDGELREAWTGMAVTLTLEDDVDLSRGDLLVPPENLPPLTTSATAMLVWMSEEPLHLGRGYLVKHNTKLLNATVAAIGHRVNVNSLAKEPASTLGLNEIAQVSLALAEPIAFDAYEQNRATGAFVVIDRLSNNTVGAGMLLGPTDAAPAADETARAALAAYHRRHAPKVGAAKKAERFGQRPVTLLLTGVVGAGKSTLAHELEARLVALGHAAQALHGASAFIEGEDDSPALALRRLGALARVLNEAGLITVAALVLARAEERALLRELVGSDRYLEVRLTAPLEVCQERDGAGLWELAARGALALPGASSPYETATIADLTLDTEALSLDECVVALLGLLRERGFLSSSE